MKKFFILLLVFIFCSPVSAQEITQPQWSDFCPIKYLNAEYKKLSVWKSLSKNNKEKNYWALRRSVFYKEIESCNQITDNNVKINCYMQIGQIETNKNIQKQIAKLQDSIYATQNYIRSNSN